MAACKSDVKSAILNKVMDELVEGRYSFTRIAGDTIQLNNRFDNSKTKVNSTSQANAIANQLLTRTKQSFNNQVSGYVSQVSAYDPITVTFTVNDSYIDHIFSNISSNRQNEELSEAEKERDFVNNNTDINSNRQIMMFSPSTTEEGGFIKFVQYRKSLLNMYQNRLNRVKSAMKVKGVSVAELTNLKRQERELSLKISGNRELGIKGIEQEIEDLSKEADIHAVGFYAEKDLKRLESLAESKNIDDLKEAKTIVSFYNQAANFRWEDVVKSGANYDHPNPFFTAEEIFLADDTGKLTPEIRLGSNTIATYEDWARRANGFNGELVEREKEHTLDLVNTNPSVKKAYGNREFSFEDLMNNTEGLKDTHWVDMWTMDITNGIFSKNGILPQVMFSYLTNSFEKKLAWAREVEEKIDKLGVDVQNELIKLGFSLKGSGIIGLKGASFQLFKEITKEGNETGAIVSRFVKSYYDAEAKAKSDFWSYRSKANNLDKEDYDAISSIYNKAFEELKKFRRNNSIILDVTKIPEITSDAELASIGIIPNTDTSHKQELLDILGQKGYDEAVEEQKAKLRKYISDRESIIDTILISESKSVGDTLSDEGKTKLEYWEHNHSPMKGNEDYHSVTGIYFAGFKNNNWLDYNSFVARKNKVIVSANPTTNKYEFKDTGVDAGNYSENFKTIEVNPTLSKFYDVVKEVSEKIREVMPYELQKGMQVGTLPGLKKSLSEILADKNHGILSNMIVAYRHLMDKIRTGFGIVKQSQISYATIDPITGQGNYKVNDGFLNSNERAINDRSLIEKTKFMQAWNSNKPKDGRLSKIKSFSVFSLSAFNTESLILLAQFTNTDISLADIKARNLSTLQAKVGNNVEIGRIIRDFSIHSVVQSQSFDLAKLSKYFANMAMMYAGRQEALPLLEIVKKHYDAIKAPETTNMGKTIFNKNSKKNNMKGLRVNGMKQLNDWFDRVVLDNYGGDHAGEFGFKLPSTKEEDALIGKTIYSSDERKKLNEVNALIAKETDEKKIEELKKIKAGLGKSRTATALIDNLLAWTRTLGLGYNVSSATTNFLEGFTSNMLLASSGEHFDPNEIYYGYSVARSSFIKNGTFGLVEAGSSRKNRKLMDKFNVIMDSKNELQKSSHKTYASKFSWLNPHELNQRVEFVNQSPIMIAMLRSIKIKDKAGKEEKLWNAFDKNGHLQDDFRTEENIHNWEALAGDDYLNFKQKLHKTIVLGHGNYDELRGMMAKSSSGGKAVMMFKTWLPQQLYWRFAMEQDDLQAGITGFKGTYRSHTRTTAAFHGALIGTVGFGPIGGLALMGLGALLGSKGADSGISTMKQTVEVTKQLFLKALGMPINTLAGRKLIGTGNDAFNSWIGTTGKSGKVFTERDARNLRTNMADLSMQLIWFALMLITKSIFWDDDDEPDSVDRQIHNVAVNKFTQLGTQAAMYVNPVDIYGSTIGSMAVVTFLTNVGKELTALEKAAEGRDIVASGSNAGESRFSTQTKKLLMPGMFKDTKFGFDASSKRVFEDSPFQQLFKSDEKKDKESNKADRAELRNELRQSPLYQQYEDTKEREKMIEKEVDSKLPTPKKLEKLGMTREEYQEALQGSQ